MSGDRLVGVRLEASCAVVAVVRPQPLRLVAVAEVALPLELSQRDEQLAERAFARTRRQLALPRWSPVALTAGEGLPVTAYAVLLARAGLPVGAMPSAEAAGRRWSTSDIRLDGALSPLSGSDAVALAVGAALTGSPAAPSSSPFDETQTSFDDYGGGWLVEPLHAPDSGRTR